MSRPLTAALAALMLAGPAAAQTPPAPVSAAAQHESLTERNRAVMTDFARLFYTEGKISQAFDTYVAPD